ncbi:hypothetical protein [Anaerococcus prevotii]|uniref:hypothetical protein n=1 Tax=Anaerococcus prevotii TaxID=33034 RepID=UPI00059DE7C7|nr:hypothetical protein [Anaerococcus prevotii]
MKKLKTTLLAALAIFAFTACGAKENDGAKKEEAAPANEQTEQKTTAKKKIHLRIILTRSLLERP